MKQIKWIFLVYAILSAASIAGIGVAIAEESLKGTAGCVIALMIIMGLGFSKKRKLQKNEDL